MSRKPVHKLRPEETRDAVWAEIRNWTGSGYGLFTTRAIAHETMLKVEAVREYLTGLTNAGYLERTGTEGIAKAAAYRLIKDCGVEAPRVRKDGAEVTMGRGREQIWRALGILAQKKSRFSIADLALHSASLTLQPSEGDVKHYLRYLAAAGYVHVSPGKTGSTQQYMMLQSKWTGPKPPQIQRVHQLYDPNSKQVVWSENGGDE